MPTTDCMDQKEPLTPEALAEDRARMIAIYKGEGVEIAAFTCDDCGARFTCGLAFDAYNVDGDCLMEK